MAGEPAPLRVLIVGGYGFFGERLARLLGETPRLQLIIAGRDLAKAQALCNRLPARAQAARFDRDGALEAALRDLAPDVVVDASGPFQAYGEDPYRLVHASLAVGADYLDLADDAAFFAGIGQFDTEARRLGRVVLTGLSTLPALSGAAVRSLTVGLDQVERIAFGIAPSPFAGLGLNVVRAIARYAGHASAAPGGRSGVPLADTRLGTVAPPGALPLRARTFSFIQYLPSASPRWPAAWAGAGTAPESLHWGLNILARLVHWRVLPSLEPFAGLFHWAMSAARWGDHRGGMFVEVDGRTGERTRHRSWHLIAEGDDGPFIPAMASAAVITAMADGRRPAPGARTAEGALELADFQPLFAHRRIVTGAREDEPGAGLMRRILGPALDTLPPAMRSFHDGEGDTVHRGEAEVERGRGPLAWLACNVIGFPASGAGLAASVEVQRRNGTETWRRTFAGRAFVSRLGEGRGRWAHLLTERFGPITFAIALVAEGGRLNYVVRGWRFLGLPLPRALAPLNGAFEHAEDGRFHFDVEIALPVVGRLVRYRGWLNGPADR